MSTTNDPGTTTTGRHSMSTTNDPGTTTTTTGRHSMSTTNDPGTTDRLGTSATDRLGTRATGGCVDIVDTIAQGLAIHIRAGLAATAQRCSRVG